MKIVHSFWSLPSFKKNNHFHDDRAQGGWLDQKYNLFSWALSCLRARAHYTDVELVTDDRGKELLIGCLKLPYSHCSTRLNEIAHYPEDLWTLGKLFTYSIQEEPFLHIDGDVYFWEKLGDAVEQAPLAAQHLEKGLHFYKHTLRAIQENDVQIPQAFRPFFFNDEEVFAINAGIIGGNDLDFIRYYASVAIDFIRQNLSRLKKMNISIFGVFVEQFFFHMLARMREVPIRYLDERLVTSDQQYYRFNEMYGIPHHHHFVHMLGSSTKKDPFKCESLGTRLRIEYPTYYYRIMDFLRHPQ